MLQFGVHQTGLVYRDRPTAFGLLIEAGRLACVRVDRGEGSYFDLPGGAVDGTETEPEALIREFTEETGLTVRPVARLVEVAQYFRKSDGTPLNNRGGVWTAEQVAFDPAARVEADHELVWLDPVVALSSLRHEAHAWAVALWLRQSA
ncbi:NUDIX domain-containing protein [uncultured Brevundimonas sp.]|uniref:NUDIX domain-containing protein n=1 Tax=uncultured Brevundimonas sp. TaxID=213418 RepID=UPI0030ECCB7C|tara:strand:- start:478 stop:921 length:444 start_codon:yes stop_codon:yes gene_type:complete